MRVRERFEKHGIAWGVVVGLVLIHAAAAVLGAWFFSWWGVLAFIAMSAFTGMVGITAGYHRLITHQSFKTYRPVRWAFAIVGSMAGQGTVFKWTADHRKHHLYSDQADDLHSPVQNGFWFSHALWTMLGCTRAELQAHYDRYIRDLQRDAGLRVIDRLYGVFVVLPFVVLLLAGWLWQGWQLGMSLMVWGGFVRLMYVYHITWFVNSATHVWGYRTYETTDNSRNNWWVGLLAFGEGWHNNHHAHQAAANHGFHRWWEFDLTYVFIRVLRACRLAWDVQFKQIEAKAASP